MEKENSIKIFNDKKIRTKWDEEIEDYYYSIIDVIAVLTDSKNPSQYWRTLKSRLNEESGQSVTSCNKLKMPASDGKSRLTDVASTNNLISLLNKIKSKNKDEFINWLNQNKLKKLYDENNTTNTLLYCGDEGAVSIEVIIDKENETMWATQKTIAGLFKVSKQNISYHLKDIFLTGELDENSVVKEILTTAPDNKKYTTKFYNLDVIISVGYRINSKNATQFRIWATKTLKEYIVKGFVLDDELLKNGTKFGKDYFDELLEKIRDIRTSERRFYQKITDIFAECSYDYAPNSEITKNFYSKVQNKLHFAITGDTAAELIDKRVNHEKEFMGLTSWKDGPKGKIRKSDVTIAKNYLTQEELSELNRMVSMYLDYAENQAAKHRLMSMEDWAERLDLFLEFNEYDVLTHKGKIRMDLAKQKAVQEYEKYNPIQDKMYKSDFDYFLEEFDDKFKKE